MKKIGVVAQYLDSRNDIREVIRHLAQNHQVQLYLRKNDLEKAVPGTAVREITARRKTLKNELLARLFYLFGQIPRSRQNYFIVEQFKIANTKTRRLFKLEKKTLLFLSRFLPRFISYDQYLDWLDYSPTTPVADVDAFLCFTEIYDDAFLKHLLRTGKPTFVYVYSWDHPCKMPRFSRRVQRYLVWNEGLREDMVQLQGIPCTHVRVVGSSQLAYIAEFRKDPAADAPPFPFDYLYFGCATGTPGLVKQEVGIIAQLAAALAEAFPGLRLVVRPYPFLGAWHLYEPLRAYDNVYFDDAYRTTSSSAALTRQQIYEKFVKIKHAKAFIHIGTTMGYEATYFDTPVLQVNFQVPGGGAENLHGFIHQYQNDKYLMPEGYPNVVTDARDFREKITRLLAAPGEFLRYNRHVAGQTRVADFDGFCQALLEGMHHG
ncbi:MAG: hypothetical protein ICV83_06790 [Cytophagales bacterium]|nr:hypothetical protein [Cytophagales bacterium]